MGHQSPQQKQLFTTKCPSQEPAFPDSVPDSPVLQQFLSRKEFPTDQELAEQRAERLFSFMNFFYPITKFIASIVLFDYDPVDYGELERQKQLQKHKGKKS